MAERHAAAKPSSIKSVADTRIASRSPDSPSSALNFGPYCPVMKEMLNYLSLKSVVR